METRTTGLILGKFAPFHKGHQYLLEFAKSRVDKLYVLIYDAKETTHIPLETRADWIRKIYFPDVTVITGHNSPTADDHTAETMKLQDDYIVSMMPEKIDFFFSSEWYGEHVAQALGAKNVVVDKDRIQVPVSGTKIRNGEVPSYEYLHPIVNRDVVSKVLILGAESTGKTTLAQALAEKFNTTWVPEYGRDYWNEHHDDKGKLSAEQLVELAKIHRRHEEEAFQKANHIVFIDTGATTTRQYCRDYGYSVPMELDTMVHDERSRYDLFALCNTDIPFVQDGTRRSEKVRKETHKKIIADLTYRGIPYYIVRGDLDTRVKNMSASIRKWLDIY